MPRITRPEPERDLFKNRYSRASVTAMGRAIKAVCPTFDLPGFVASVITDDFPRLEFKDRGRAIARALAEYLPGDYGRAVDVLIAVAPRLDGFHNWAAMTFIELQGLAHFEDSVRGMKALTRYSTAESAIRPFLNSFPDRLLPILHEWAADPDEHVRRLAAEGSRPRGVWVAHIGAYKKDPRPVLALLEKLKADPSKYVRTAVANNLNDISKDHPDLVITAALRWLKDGDAGTTWIVRHACRSLIKKGDPRVFPIFGFTANPKISVTGPRPPRRAVAIGADAAFPFTVTSRAQSRQKLAIDYRVHYVKKNGKTSPKVFKLAEKTIAPGETLALQVRQSFADVSVRKHVPGRHRLEIIVNGRTVAAADFTLA
ncbi:MAG TPA: DNA alkylation repair protein [candidate division Zixibacteria bacterium]|nr:DNA alkylation repair protein [candidate division Zixibacteria bacterium]MDD4917463.1 DNA alkylation repair protein [candidate division Zixibacteria bacterium]MDM7972322.1 DNA alkylation repair protein [candidate division Zixibacteria bacterium]HOD66854.1 DNA alkylation repair protein [candidate division Zixibacteria bacterium]HOZ06808.1 DNA alkylation repair protein [candidate division Zixibacteria bacterium]